MPAFFNSDVLACFIFLHGLFFFGVMDTSSFSRHERIFISLVVFLSRTFFVPCSHVWQTVELIFRVKFCTAHLSWIESDSEDKEQICAIREVIMISNSVFYHSVHSIRCRMNSGNVVDVSDV